MLCLINALIVNKDINFVAQKVVLKNKQTNRKPQNLKQTNKRTKMGIVVLGVHVHF